MSRWWARALATRSCSPAKAYRALQTATLVLYDHLVGPAVLDCIAPGAERIYVGGNRRATPLPQEQIIELMVRLARSGRNVVRLGKGRRLASLAEGARKCRPWPRPALALTWCPASPAQGRGRVGGHSAHAPRPRLHPGVCHRPPARRPHRGLDWELLARPRQTVA